MYRVFKFDSIKNIVLPDCDFQKNKKKLKLREEKNNTIFPRSIHINLVDYLLQLPPYGRICNVFQIFELFSINCQLKPFIQKNSPPRYGDFNEFSQLSRKIPFSCNFLVESLSKRTSYQTIIFQKLSGRYNASENLENPHSNRDLSQTIRKSRLVFLRSIDCDNPIK